MSRYVEIDAEIAKIKHLMEIHQHRKEEYGQNDYWDWSKGVKQAEINIREAKDDLALLESLPTADVVEVVRCKDCRYYSEPNRVAYGRGNYKKKYCTRSPLIKVNEYDYCSYGERREDGI